MILKIKKMKQKNCKNHFIKKNYSKKKLLKKNYKISNF